MTTNLHVWGSAGMGGYVYSIWIEATPAQVWHTYVDPHRIPEWQTGRPVIDDVHGGPGVPGSTYVSKRGPLVARTTVLASTAPGHLVTRTEAYLGLQFELDSRLTDRAGGTELQLSAQTRWPPGRQWLGRVLDRVFLSRREADKELASLKTLIERDAAH